MRAPLQKSNLRSGERMVEVDEEGKEGLLQLQLQAPVLSMLPDSNQIRAVLPVLLSGPVLKQTFQGQLDVSFGLRYEPSDRTLRAQRVLVNSLQIADAPPALADMLTTYGPRLGEQVLGNLVLHQFEDKDLALADTIRVTSGHELDGLNDAQLIDVFRAGAGPAGGSQRHRHDR